MTHSWADASLGKAPKASTCAGPAPLSLAFVLLRREFSGISSMAAVYLDLLCVCVCCCLSNGCWNKAGHKQTGVPESWWRACPPPTLPHPPPYPPPALPCPPPIPPPPSRHTLPPPSPIPSPCPPFCPPPALQVSLCQRTLLSCDSRLPTWLRPCNIGPDTHFLVRIGVHPQCPAVVSPPQRWLLLSPPAASGEGHRRWGGGRSFSRLGIW